MFPTLVDAMQSVPSPRRGQALLATAAVAAAVMLLALLWAPPSAGALDLFASHQVTVQFAQPDGKPLAGAEVRVFAPGRAGKPALTGHTDRNGRFEFSTEEDGFWTAEARSGQEIARVMVRVGGQEHEREQQEEPPSPYWVFAGLGLLLVLAVAVRILRAHARRPRT
jgi:hypothetical protein